MSEFLQQLVNGVSWGAIYALIALGYTMVYGVLRLINFAHGEVYMIGAMTGFYAYRALNFSPHAPWANPQSIPDPLLPSSVQLGLILIASIVACGCLGALIERIAYRPLRNSSKLTALITAIGVSLLLQYGGQLLFGAEPKKFPDLIEVRPVFDWGNFHVSNIQLLVVGVSVCLMAALWFLVQKTKIGCAMRAVSYSFTASQFTGIPVNRIITVTFVIGSALAGAAGVLVGISNPKIDPLMGLLPGLKAFIAAVLGGVGSIPGALIGGFLLGICETFVTAYFSSTYRDAVAFLLLIFILLIRPTGILGKKAIVKV